jgi:hypothetical protein
VDAFQITGAAELMADASFGEHRHLSLEHRAVQVIVDQFDLRTSARP